VVAERIWPNAAKRNEIRLFYAPIVWLHDYTFLKKPLQAYLDLWGVK